MDIGDTFRIKNRKYTVIQIWKKKHREQDILLCKTNLYRECFQRFDLEGGQEHELTRDIRVNEHF